MGYCTFLFSENCQETGVFGRSTVLTEKELKKLNRYQLLELLIIQTERADKLEKKLEEMQEKLDSREVQLTVMGSIAEASMQLSGVFEAAQNAADMYVNAAKERAVQIEKEAVQRAEAILGAALQRAENL